jgi:hypothetical protein
MSSSISGTLKRLREGSSSSDYTTECGQSTPKKKKDSAGLGKVQDAMASVISAENAPPEFSTPVSKRTISVISPETPDYSGQPRPSPSKLEGPMWYHRADEIEPKRKAGNKPYRRFVNQLKFREDNPFTVICRKKKWPLQKKGFMKLLPNLKKEPVPLRRK